MSAEILHFWPMADATNRIRELRLAAGLSQQKLGDRMSVSKMTISDLEVGKVKLTLDYMRRVAEALGCAPADLLNPEDNPWQLAPDERRLLERYRAADPQQQEIAEGVLDALFAGPSRASR